MSDKKRLFLKKCKKWKAVKINRETVEIPLGWGVDSVSKLTKNLDSIRKPLNSTQRKKGAYPYWGANSIVDYVSDYLVDGEVILLGEDAAPFFDKTKKVAFYSNEKIWPNNHIHVLRAKDNQNAKYLIYQLNLFDYSKVLNTKSRPKLTQTQLNGMELFTPPIQEQNNIAHILTQQESLISKIQSLIELEKNRLTYLSDKLLSGAIRVSLKKDQAGVETLELYANQDWKTIEVNGEMVEVPVEWTASKIEDRLHFSLGNTPAKIGNNYAGDLPWITISNMGQKKISDFTAKIKKTNNVKVLPAGTLVGSFKMSVGKFGFLSEKSATNEAIISFEKDKNKSADLEYLYYCLPNVFLKNATRNGQGVLLLNTKTIKKLYYVDPPIQEQQNIARLLIQQENRISQYEILLEKEQQRLDWLLENLLSGTYLLEEIDVP